MKSQISIELKSSAHSSYKNENFVNSGKKLVENSN